MYKDKDLATFLQYLDLEKHHIDALLNDFNVLEKHGIIKIFSNAVNKLEQQGFPTREYYLFLEEIPSLIKDTPVSEYTAYFIFICTCAPYAYNILEKQGYCQEIIKNSFDDYRVKVNECYDLYKVVGTFVPAWFIGFIQGRRVKLGRLQFAREVSRFDYEKFGVSIKKGDEIIAIHIPSGEKLTLDSVLYSLRSAYEFYGAKDNMPFSCHTAFLFEDYLPVFKKGSNIRRFADLFDVVGCSYTDSFDNCWRFFNCNYNGNPDDLPNNNSLQKGFIEVLKNGCKHGEGFGYLVYDGKNVLTQKQD